MKKLLEDIWYSYEMERNSEISSEEKKILNKVIKNQEKLNTCLNDESKKMFEEHENLIKEMSCIAEKMLLLKACVLHQGFWLKFYTVIRTVYFCV